MGASAQPGNFLVAGGGSFDHVAEQIPGSLGEVSTHSDDSKEAVDSLSRVPRKSGDSRPKLW